MEQIAGAVSKVTATRIIAILFGFLFSGAAAFAQDMWVMPPDGGVAIPLYRQPSGGLSIRPPQPATPVPEKITRAARAYCLEVAVAASDVAKLGGLKSRWGDGSKVNMQNEVRVCASQGFVGTEIEGRCKDWLPSEQDGTLYAATSRNLVDAELAKNTVRECGWLIAGIGPDPFTDLHPPRKQEPERQFPAASATELSKALAACAILDDGVPVPISFFGSPVAGAVRLCDTLKDTIRSPQHNEFYVRLAVHSIYLSMRRARPDISRLWDTSGAPDMDNWILQADYANSNCGVLIELVFSPPSVTTGRMSDSCKELHRLIESRFSLQALRLAILDVFRRTREAGKLDAQWAANPPPWTR